VLNIVFCNMGKYDNFLIEQVRSSGGALGQQLRELLQVHFGVTPDNGRKIVERARGDDVLKCSDPLTFGKGQFLYIEGKKKFSYKRIKDFSQSTRPPLFRLLVLLELNGGVASRYEALKVTSSPDEKTRSKVSLLSDIVSDLSKLGFLTERQDGNGIHYILAQPPIKENDREAHYLRIMARHFEYMKLDTCFTPDILRWLKESNLASNEEYSYRGMKTPGLGAVHNKLSWDAYTYTKTTGLNPGRASQADSIEKQTFMALDIIIARPYEQIDLDGFYSRLQIHRNSVKTAGKRADMPVIVYREIEDQVLNRARLLGYLTYKVDQLYGKEVSRILDSLRSLFINPDDDRMEDFDIEGALNVIEQSGHSEQLKALRGVLFESLMYPFLKRFYPNAIIHRGKVLQDPVEKSKYREFDYVILSSNPPEVVLVELKGYPSNSSIALGSWDAAGTVKYFFEGSVPLAKRYFKADLLYEHTSVKCMFITSGGYYEDSNSYLSQMAECSLKPSDLDLYYDGNRLIMILEQYGFNHDASIIKRFYQRKPKDFDEI
jgi:hypothetical protein